jgi:hypothetical protein
MAKLLRNSLQNVSRLLRITSIQHKFSSRKWFRLDVHPPFSPTIHFKIQSFAWSQEANNHYKIGWWWWWQNLVQRAQNKWINKYTKYGKLGFFFAVVYNGALHTGYLWAPNATGQSVITDKFMIIVKTICTWQICKK